jgi:hypothetical protein
MYIVNIKAGKINKELCVVLNDISETQCFTKRRFFATPALLLFGLGVYCAAGLASAVQLGNCCWARTSVKRFTA